MGTYRKETKLMSRMWRDLNKKLKKYSGTEELVKKLIDISIKKRTFLTLI
jgi:hypothetical protein